MYSLSTPCPPPELSPSPYRPGSPSVKRTKTEPLIMWAFLPPSLAATTLWVTLPSSLSPSLPYFTSRSCWTHLQNIQNIQSFLSSLAATSVVQATIPHLNSGSGLRATCHLLPPLMRSIWFILHPSAKGSFYFKTLLLKVISTPNKGLELTVSESRVTCSTESARLSQRKLLKSKADCIF